MSILANALRFGATDAQERAAVHLLLHVPTSTVEVIDRPDVRTHIHRMTRTVAVVAWSHLSLAITDGAVRVTGREAALIRIACAIGGGARVNLRDALAGMPPQDLTRVLEALAMAGGLESNEPVSGALERDLREPCGGALPEGVVGFRLGQAA